MRYFRLFLSIIIPILFYTCMPEREWDNPYDPDSDTVFSNPVITSIITIDFDKVEINWNKIDSNYTIIKIDRTDNGDTTSFDEIDYVDADFESAIDSSVVFGQEYIYRILGMADESEGSYSDIMTITITIPVPENLSAEALDDQQIKLTWNNISASTSNNGDKKTLKPEKISMTKKITVSSNEEKKILLSTNHDQTTRHVLKTNDFIEGYIIQRAAGNGSFSTIDSVLTVYQYIDKELIYGTTYKYRISSYVSTYKSNYSDEIQATTIFPEPTSLDAVVTGETRVQLSWNDNCIFETGYEIWRKSDENDYSLIETKPANSTTYTNLGLVHGVEYVYKVCAITSANTSNFTNEKNIAVIINTPTNLTSSPLNDHQITLTWNDNCLFENGSQILIKPPSGSFSIIDSVEENITNYTFSDLPFSITYLFKIKSFSDNFSSEFSEMVSGATVFPSPSGLIVLQSGENASLSWDDNCNFESGYIIHRSVDEGASYTIIDSVDENDIQYIDTTTVMDVNYYYKINAYSEFNSSDFSESVEFSLFAGTMLYITPTGSDFTGDGTLDYPYKTIQKGIDMSEDGDMIIVAEGTYNENIDYDYKQIIIGSLFALDYDTTHISSTIISGLSSSGQVVYMNRTQTELIGLTVTSSTEYNTGVHMSNSGTISNCVITGITNLANNQPAGIYITNGGEIVNSKIYNNYSEGYSYDQLGGGIFIEGTTNIVNSQIYNNGVGINTNCCTNYNANGGGIYIHTGSNVIITNCSINNNYVSRINTHGYTYGGGIYSSYDNNLDIYDSDISGNYLSNSGSSMGGSGIFSQTDDMSINNSTINDNYFDGVDENFGNAGGIQISASSASINGCIIDGNEGNGVITGAGTSFTDCTISNNTGYGIYSSSTYNTYSRCSVISNGSTGILTGSNGTFIDVIATNNGLGGLFAGTSSTFDFCTTIGNSGIGFSIGSSGFFTNCIASNNTIGYGIGSNSTEMINCIAVDNDSIGVSLNNSSTLLRNCTISGNNTGIYAGGTSGPAYMNTIIFGNQIGLDGESGATMTIDYSNIENGNTYAVWTNGTGNISIDPEFVGDGDYHLLSTSPCINAGNPSNTYNDADGSRNDMGAYGGPDGNW